MDQRPTSACDFIAAPDPLVLIVLNDEAVGVAR